MLRIHFPFLLAMGVLITSSESLPVSARSTDACEKLTGRDRSRCLMNERRTASDTRSKTQTSPRSSSPSTSTISRPSVPRSASPGSSSSPGDFVTGSRVTISWSSVSGAAEYDFGIRDMTSNRLLVDTQTGATSYTARIEKG